MKFAGREYLNHPMELNIWRAPTDNDMYIKSEWKKAHYDKAYTRAYTTEVAQGKHGGEDYKPCFRCGRDGTEDS